MDTISFDDLKQMVGELYIDNVLLKKKIGYLESMIEQLRPQEGEMTEQEKEDKPAPSRQEIENEDY